MNENLVQEFEDRVDKLARRQLLSGAIKPIPGKVVLRFNSRDLFDRFVLETGCGTNVVYGFGCIYCYLDTTNSIAVATAIARYKAYIPWIRLSHKHFQTKSEHLISSMP